MTALNHFVPSFGRRHQRALDAIRTSVRDRGYPPTVRELAEAIGVSSSATAADVLRQLEDLGRIRRAPNSSRAIEIVDEEQPQVLGVTLPVTTDLRTEIGLMQRLAEALLSAGRDLRELELHMTAAEVEYAAQSLLAGADQQVQVLAEQAAARRGTSTG